MLLLSLVISASQANAMQDLLRFWRPQNEISTGFLIGADTTMKDALKHASYLLEMMNLSAFVAHTEEFSLNPNYFKTQDGETALSFACRYDFNGDLFEKLLSFGGFYLPRNKSGVLECLSTAVEVNNYMVISILSTNKNIITDRDLSYTAENRRQYRKLRRARR